MNALHSLLILIVVGTLVSCGSDKPAKPKPVGPVSSALQSGHWKLVRKRPPTYFPAETPSDHPTSYRDGFWVNSGDSRGTRFFIPAHGTKLSQEHLIAEAQAAMSPAARKELKEQGREIRSHNIAAGTLKGVVQVLGAMGQAMAGAGGGGYPSGSYKKPKAPTQPTPKPPAPPATPPTSE